MPASQVLNEDFMSALLLYLLQGLSSLPHPILEFIFM